MASTLSKIYPDCTITVTPVDMTLLGFVDGKAVPKGHYSLVDHQLNLLQDSKEDISIYYNLNQSQIYEYSISLYKSNTIISGVDLHYNELQNITTKRILVFVNGILLNQNEYTIIDNKTISINNSYTSPLFSQVIIYVSENDLTYSKLIPAELENIQLPYNINTTLIFLNGKKLKYDLITPIEIDSGNISAKINININEDDLLEYYDLGGNTQSLNFLTLPGYVSYGPTDDNQNEIPIIYNGILDFPDQIKLLVDNIRFGFILKEEIGFGEATIVDNNFETTIVKVLITQPFKKTLYNIGELYFEVPHYTNITKYLSNYDNSFIFLPEILNVYQRVLLDEIQDTIKRIRDIRSLTKVDSYHINKLIQLLGFNLDIKTLTLKQRHELLEELNNYYNIVGTEDSYNFFNVIQNDLKIVNIQQLFTPINNFVKEKTIYNYDYTIVTPGSGYKINQVLNISGTDLSLKVLDVNETGGITAIIPFAYEGYSDYSGTYNLYSPSYSTYFSCNSVATDYSYNWAINSAEGYSVGAVLHTIDDAYKLTVDEVDDNGKITKFTPSITEGKTSISVLNALLYPITDLSITINSTDVQSNGEEVLLYSKYTPGKFTYNVSNIVSITRIVMAGGNGSKAWDLTLNAPLTYTPGKGNIKTVTDVFCSNRVISGVVGASPTDDSNIGGTGYNNGGNGATTNNIRAGGGGGSTAFKIDDRIYEVSGGGGVGKNSGKGAGPYGGASSSNNNSNGKNATENNQFNDKTDGWIEIYGYTNPAKTQLFNILSPTNIEITLDPGKYYIDISGGGGSGGAADSIIGSEYDLEAQNGFAGERITNTFVLTKATKVKVRVGGGAKGGKARGDDRYPIASIPGITDGKQGNIKGGTYYYTVSGSNAIFGNLRYKKGNAAAGSGGGSTELTLDDGRSYLARGGDGGDAKWVTDVSVASNNTIVVGLPGGIGAGRGGAGGTRNGTGAAGGSRAYGGNFYAKDGQNGWVKIWRINQNYTSTINGDQRGVRVNDSFKSADNLFTVTVNSISEGKITDYTLSPTFGIDVINNQTMGLSLIQQDQLSTLSISSTGINFIYNTQLEGNLSGYVIGDTLVATQNDNTFTLTVTDNDPTNFKYTYTPSTGTKNISINDAPIEVQTGSGAKVSIKFDSTSQSNYAREYVDFYTKEELGAIFHREYVIPTVDYGFVYEGSPNSPEFWRAGLPDINYEYVSVTAQEYIDYGYVNEQIKGTWVEWWEWDRDGKYYPTNHVEIEIKLPIDTINYEEALNRFNEQFYNLASTVLYIHRLVQCFYFGNNITNANNPDTSHGAFLGIQTWQPVSYDEYTFTSDPKRQAF